MIRTHIIIFVIWIVLASAIMGNPLTRLIAKNTAAIHISRNVSISFTEFGTQSETASKQAVSLFSATREFSPEDRTLLRGVVVALVLQHREDEARNLATGLGLGSGDMLFQIGRLFEGRRQFKSALMVYEQAIDIKDFEYIGISDVYCSIGVIYQRKLDTVRINESLQAYERALRLDQFSSSSIAADCNYRYAEVLRWLGRDIDKYMTAYRRAIQLDPKHLMARVWYATSLYTKYGNREAAIAEIQPVLATNDLWAKKWAYLNLGDIYRQEERPSEAISMYRKALEIDPEFTDAYTRLSWINEGR